MSFRAVTVKEEPHCEEHGAGSAGRVYELQIKPEPESDCSDNELQQEPADRQEARVKSEEPHSLYKGHDVKVEIVIGPEVLQQPLLPDNTIAVKPTIPQCCTHGGQSQEDCNLLIEDNCKKTDNITHSQGNGLLTCDVCNKKFTRRYDLTCHQRIHSGEKSFACDICNKKFTHKSNLTYHQRIHSDEKAFACDICNKKFTYKSNLTHHQRLHSGEKPFACDICNKNFTRRSHLTYHQLVHSGEKLFACDICKKKFTLKSNLTYHQRTIHSDEKRFTCDICNMKFTWRYELKRHQYMHM